MCRASFGPGLALLAAIFGHLLAPFAYIICYLGPGSLRFFVQPSDIHRRICGILENSTQTVKVDEYPVKIALSSVGVRRSSLGLRVLEIPCLRNKKVVPVYL